MKKEHAVWVLSCVAFVALIAALIVLVVREERSWERYKLEHDCQETPETRVIPVQSGKTTIYVTQHRWDCGDGEDHWH